MKYADIMKPQTQNPHNTESDHTTITPTQMFAVLSDERRQYALVYLSQKPAAIYLGDLAEYIAIKEEEPSQERYQRILVDLHHRHLPLLCSAGLVDYDKDTELLEFTADCDLIAPYLQLTEHAE